MAISTVDRTEEALAEIDGVSSKIRRIKLDALNVDRSYQRDLSMPLVEQIRDHWDELASELVLVSEREDGSLWIINGQHRSAAARLRGESHIDARVVKGLTVEREASLRLKTNVRITDRPLERFKGKVAARDAEALSIVGLLAQFDTEINETQRMDEGVNSIGAIEALYRVDEGQLLFATLRVIEQAYARVGPKTASAYLVKSIGWFIQRHADEIDRDRLVERLKATGTAQLERSARTMMGAMGGSLWSNYYRAIVDAYNERLADRSRLEWRLRGAGRFDRLGRGGNPWAKGGWAQSVYEGGPGSSIAQDSGGA